MWKDHDAETCESIDVDLRPDHRDRRVGDGAGGVQLGEAGVRRRRRQRHDGLRRDNEYRRGGTEYAVEQNVGLVPSLEDWDEPRVRERVHEMLSLVGLDPKKFADRYPRELSGGQRQRVGVARALAADPPLLLMDEPFGALDPLTRASLQKEFAELKERLGKTVVFVTHDVREALMLGSRIALMDKGKVVLLDTPQGFVKSNDEHARAYLETLRNAF